MSKKHVVVSLGHDALGYTTLEQRDAVRLPWLWRIWWRRTVS